VSGITPLYSGSAQTYGAGKYNQAALLTNPVATSDTPTYYQFYATSGAFQSSVGFTISFWFNQSNKTSLNSYQGIIGFNSTANSYFNDIFVTPGANGTIGFYGQNPAGSGIGLTIPSPVNAVVGAWYHVAFVMRTGITTMYLNGNQYGTGTYPNEFTISEVRISSTGQYTGHAFCGSVDDLRIYNTALTAAQVQSIYNQQGVPGRGAVVSSKRAPGSTAIYSTNWVNPSYSGAIVNVERASDGTTSDFYVDKSGNFATSSGTSLSSWLAGAQANVLIWYDQSGSGLNAIKDNTTVYGRAPQLVTDPAGSGKYVIYFPNQNSSNVSYYGFRISPQTTSSMMCRFYMPTGKIGDSNWESLLCTNIDNQGVRFRPLTMTTGDGNDFLNPGGFAIHDGTLNTTSPYLTTTKGSWHTMMASRASGTLSMEYIGQCNNAWNNGSIIPRSFYGYMTDMVTFSSPPGQSAYSAYFSSPTTTYTGTPLFTQLSTSATSSAVGAFSLRAVNGTSARAVQVRPVAAVPAAAMSSNGPQTLTGYSFGGGGSYTASVSSFGGSSFGWKVFDKDINTYWNTNYTYTGAGANSSNTYIVNTYSTTVSGSTVYGEWIQIQMPTAIYPYTYTLTPPYDAAVVQRGFPYQWTLAGSNDGAIWTTVDTQNGINTWTNLTPKTFTSASSSTAYSYYRLIVQAVNSYSTLTSQLLNISEWTVNGSNASWNTDFYADRLGNLLTAPVTGQSLAKWLGGATGYVTTWYDQSGAGQHMAQTTASLQPIISLATSPPSILFTGNGTTSGQYFQNTIPFTFNFGTNYQYSIRAVVNNTVGGVLVYKGKQGAPWNGNGEKAWYLGPSSLTSTSGNYPDLVGFAEGWVITSTPITSSKTSVTWASSSFSSVAVYENASSVTPSYTRASQLSDASNYLYFGITTASGVPYYNGNIYEIEIFSTPLSVSDVTIMG
jgi:hypothetical protein